MYFIFKEMDWGFLFVLFFELLFFFLPPANCVCVVARRVKRVYSSQLGGRLCAIVVYASHTFIVPFVT